MPKEIVIITETKSEIQLPSTSNLTNAFEEMGRMIDTVLSEENPHVETLQETPASPVVPPSQAEVTKAS